MSVERDNAVAGEVEVATGGAADIPAAVESSAVTLPPMPEGRVDVGRRIAEIKRQITQLYREMAWLTMEYSLDGSSQWKCQRCGYEWESKRLLPPKNCAYCHSPAWQTESKHGVSRKMSSRIADRPRRHVGRPSRKEIAAEVARRKREEADRALRRAARQPVGSVTFPDGVPPAIAGLPGLPPPPKPSADDPAFLARLMPSPRILEPEPSPSPDEPAVEPAAEEVAPIDDDTIPEAD